MRRIYEKMIFNPIDPKNPKNHSSDKSYDIVKAHRGTIKVETALAAAMVGSDQIKAQELNTSAVYRNKN